MTPTQDLHLNANRIYIFVNLFCFQVKELLALLYIEVILALYPIDQLHKSFSILRKWNEWRKHERKQKLFVIP